MNDLKFKTENKREGLIAQRMSRQPMQSRKPASDQLPYLSHESKPRMEWSKPQKRIWVSYRLFHYYYPKKNRQGLGAYYAVVGRMSYHTKFGLHIANADHLKWQQAHKIDDSIKGGSSERHHRYREGTRAHNHLAANVGFGSQIIIFRKDGRMYCASFPKSQGMTADDFIPFSPAVPFTAIQQMNIHVSHSKSAISSQSVVSSASSPSASFPARPMDIDGADDFSLVPVVVPTNILVSAIPIFSASESNGITNNPGFDFSLKTTFSNIQKNGFEKWHGRNFKPTSKLPEEFGGSGVLAITDIQNKKSGKFGPVKINESAGHETRISQVLSRSSALETKNRKPDTMHSSSASSLGASHLKAGHRTPETGNRKPATPYIYPLRPHRLRYQSVIGAEALPE